MLQSFSISPNFHQEEHLVLNCQQLFQGAWRLMLGNLIRTWYYYNSDVMSNLTQACEGDTNSVIIKNAIS
ncbi:hypothetical protein FGO68_gene4665 [Halteria grandinella]|uniref:Uncharacterized protein n=1 Tax=Halteria grandinella TaxID=5974 RepID=A0A8J8P059_HALGN|nr:hypothetical protein FGO68_gene4665 [Halteria grandinella]